MGYREVRLSEMREVIRRWQGGQSQRQISRGTGLARETVRRYIEAAEAAGIRRDGPEPTEQQLIALATLSISGPRQAETPSEGLLAPWAEQIERWVTTDRLQLTRIRELLGERGCAVSYSSLHRFVARRGWRRKRTTTVRMEETPPGEVVEMDFGYLGLVPDPQSGRRRKVWALVLVWRHSRHCFVWPTTSQRLDAVVEGLEAGWEFFGGAPRFLVIDNFPAAIAGTDPHHPRPTRGFLDYAQHRGFITDPARVRHPRDKPRVERSIPYVRERLFKGGTFRDVHDLRNAARDWCISVAGLRVHGTTRRQPLVVFQDESSRTSRPGTTSPTRCPTGAKPGSIRTTTSPAAPPSTRCRRLSVRRARRSRSSPHRRWCASATEESSSRCTRASIGAVAPPTPPTTRPNSPATPRACPTRCSGGPRSWESRWAPSPHGSSRATCPGRSSGRGTSSCASASATRPTGSTPPAGARSRSTSST